MRANFDWDEAVNTLTNTCQLLDGWHNDGTAWSDWDEKVRAQVSALLKECVARSSNPMTTKSQDEPKGHEMMRRELLSVTKRWVDECDLDYAELFGVLEILKLIYWQDWTEKKRNRGDFDGSA